MKVIDILRNILKCFIILIFLISLFMYLIIVGGNLNKSDYEKMLEDEEQLKYIKSYKNKVEDKN